MFLTYRRPVVPLHHSKCFFELICKMLCHILTGKQSCRKVDPPVGAPSKLSSRVPFAFFLCAKSECLMLKLEIQQGQRPSRTQHSSGRGNLIPVDRAAV